ncbi:MAG: right-handed parallel beta-helix repeat-containing protein [Candidatus Sulfotelmatobacter sp.]
MSSYDTASSASAAVTIISSPASTIPGTGATGATGANYYVDNSAGSDSNNGQSPLTPWRTIAKVNSSTLKPGDTILFKSGDTWREQLNIKSSGSAGNPITFSSYGSGNAPVISGADLAVGWAGSTGLSTTSTVTLWSVNESSATNQMFEDGRRLASAAGLNMMPAGSFYNDAGKVYVRTFSDDNPNTHTMEISNRNYAIYEAGGSKYITVQNLETSGANVADVYFNGSSFIAVSNVLAENSFGEGIRFDVVASSSIVSSTAAWNGSNGISADDAPGLVINGCVAHDNASLANVNYTAGIKINPDYSPYPPSTDVTVENSKSYANGLGQSDWRGAGIWADTIGNNLLVEHNLVYGNNLNGIYFDADHNETAAYNVVYGNGQKGAANGDGITVNGDGRTLNGDALYGNTVYGNLTAGIRISGAGLANGCLNNSVKNNIVANTLSGPNFSATGGCENSGANGSGNVYTYNAFGPASSNFIEYGATKFLSSYAAFDAACGVSTHSVDGDPRFANSSANNFTLQSGSPAIEAGLNLGPSYELALAPSSVWPSGVVTMNQNTQAAGWDMGAYAHTQPTIPAVQ